jgi:hypothetical protein
VWITLSVLFRRWSLRQDRAADSQPTVRLRALSGPGLVIYALTGTFAFVDWVMSIEREWFSTIFSVIVLIGQILTAFAFVTVLLARWKDEPPWRDVVRGQHFHHLGNLLLTFVMFWTYVSFGQLLIIYSGNLPREIEWYLHRIAGNWKVIVWILGLFHFALPFLLLLFRPVKLHVRPLAALAAMLFVMHLLADFWLIAPSFHPEGVAVHGFDIAAVIGIGGLWLAGFSVVLHQAPALPRNDPRIDYSVPDLAHAQHG